MRGQPSFRPLLGGKLPDRLDGVGLDVVVAHLENRSLRILVHGNDHLGVLHAGHVLDGARDAEGEIQIGGDDLARLADLRLARRNRRIDERAGAAHGRSDPVGKLHHLLPARLVDEAAAAGDHDFGGHEIGPIALFARHGDELEGARRRRGLDGAHGARSLRALLGLERRRAHRRQKHLLIVLHGREDAARVDEAAHRGRVDHLGDLRDALHVKERGGAGHGRLGYGSRDKEHMRVGAFPLHLDERFCKRFRQVIGQLRRIGCEHLMHAGNGGGSGGSTLAAASRDEHVALGGELKGCGNGAQRDALEGCIVMFGNNENFHFTLPLTTP